jgi:hypothetical protein
MSIKKIAITRNIGGYVMNVDSGGRNFKNDRSAGTTPEEAAATAITEAMRSRGVYHIFGPKDVLDCIPKEMRSGVNR